MKISLWQLGVLLMVSVTAGGPTDDLALGPGVSYRRISDANGPLSIHVLEMDRKQPDLYLTPSVGAAIKGNETVPTMASAMSPDQGIPLAAVNGGYFEISKQPRYFGVPSGIHISGGELLRGPKTTGICFDAAGQPSIRRVTAKFSVTWPDGSTTPFGLNCPTADYKSSVKTAPIVLFTPRFGPSTGATNDARELVLGPADTGSWLPLKSGQNISARVLEIRREGDAKIVPNTMILSISRKAEASAPAVRVGDMLQISTAFDPDISDVVAAVSGEPQLLGGGKGPLKPSGKTDGRAPRTMIGFNDTHIFLVVVDGRQEKLSVGMNFEEAAIFMHKLGCTEALNLDGGGSSTFWLAGRVMNSPSDGMLRAVGDCLVLMRRIKKKGQ